MFYHPQFLGRVEAVYQPLPDNSDLATNVTVQWMAEKAAADSRSDLVERVTRAAIAGADSFPAVCRAIHTWVRSHVRFVSDRVPAAGAGVDPETEVLIRPVDLLRMIEPAGDCDCISMLVASMLLAARRLGVRPLDVYFVAVESDQWRPREFSHVYVYAVHHGIVMPLDASHGPVAGWETVPKGTGRKRLWSVDGVSMIARILGGRGPFLHGVGQDATGVTESGTEFSVPAASAFIGPDEPAGAPVGSGPSIAQAILPGLVKTGETIAVQTTRPAGLFTQVTPYGSVTYSMPTTGPAAGAPSPVFPSTISAGIGGMGIGTLLLLGLGAVAVFAALKAR